MGPIIERLTTSRGRLALVLVVVSILLILFFVFFFESLSSTTNPNKYGNNTVPSTTEVVTQTLTSNSQAFFSGFGSNIVVNNLVYKNLDRSQLHNIVMPVFYAQTIPGSYFETKLGLQQSTDGTNTWRGSNYSLQVNPGEIDIYANNTSSSGNANLNTALSSVTRFYTNTLGLDGSLVTMNGTEQGNTVVVTGKMKVNGFSVFNQLDAPAFSATVNGSGNVVFFRVIALLKNFKQLGTLPINTNISFATGGDYHEGTYFTDTSASTIYQRLTNGPIVINTYAQGYFFDSSTENLIPVVRMDTSIPLLGVGGSYSVVMLQVLLDDQYIAQLVPTQAPTGTTTPHGSGEGLGY